VISIVSLSQDAQVEINFGEGSQQHKVG
jgi:hypothetical protein